MSDKTMVPEVRFKGFIGDWLEANLESKAQFQKGRGFSKNDLLDAGTPIILYGSMYTNYQTIISKVDSFVINRKDAIVSCGNEVIVPASGETPEDIARASAIVKDGIIIGGDLNIIYPNQDINNIFLALKISNGKQQNELSKRAQGKSVVHLRSNDLEAVTLQYPCIDEQSKIGNYFKEIDSLLSKHQQKYDKLVTLKKAMLEKMFPKDGEDVPEIRFEGFYRKWRNKKLEEISDVRDGTHDSPQFLNEGKIFITSKNVKNGYIELEDIQYISEDMFNEINNRSKVDVNDILMGMIGTVGNIALVREEPNYAIKNVALIKYTQKVYFQYLYTFLQTTNAIKQLDQGKDGGTQKFIALNKVRKLSISIPDNTKEETKIGNYFKKLDKLISMQKIQIEKLKNIKKSCLDKMFV